ncbi:MAG: zinc ABC transporter substrate-binding protein [Nitrospinae bacterium]|nr:zinc ABC transporter substrate-binding protein [Nitrospinota bacterium]
MPIKFLIFFIFFSLYSFPVCAEKAKIIVSIFPLGEIVREIAGETATVKVLIKGNISPHVYEPSPKDVIDLQACDLFFLIGLDMEHWAEKLINSKDYKGKPPILTGNEILKIKENHQRGNYSEHQHNGTNPHVWLSSFLTEKIAKLVYMELLEFFPDNQRYFQKNYDNFIQKTKALNNHFYLLKEKLQKLKVRIVTFHGSFHYFFHGLGFKNVRVIEQSPGKKPSLKLIKELIDFLNEGEIKAVFTEPQFSGRMARTLVKETGAEVGVLDPIGNAQRFNSYFELMEYNLREVEKTIAPQEKNIFDKKAKVL